MHYRIRLDVSCDLDYEPINNARSADGMVVFRKSAPEERERRPLTFTLISVCAMCVDSNVQLFSEALNKFRACCGPQIIKDCLRASKQ